LESYNRILEKLEGFTSRYYRRRLLKGVFLFLFLGGLLLLCIGGIEYLLWMDPPYRSALLWAGLALEAFLFSSYILSPVLHLLRIQRGLTSKEASQLIGRHFPEVGDRLFNLLELAENPDKSDLLLASIEQRSVALAPVPFQMAVQMKEAYRYSKYALLPIVLLALIWVSGNGMDFLSSYQRVVNYDLAYDPPAPFAFELLSGPLQTREDQPFVLRVGTRGDVQPGQVRLMLEGSPIIMERNEGHFEYTFRPPQKAVDFYFEATGVSSRPYTLEVIRVPVIDRFEMSFVYPDYLGMPANSVLGTGNATVPEGTRIRWDIKTIHADSIRYSDADTALTRSAEGADAWFTRRIFRTTPYAISASNEQIPEFDRLNYRIEVIPDESPEIEVEVQLDSLNANLAFFAGTASDDHGLRQLNLVAFPSDSREDQQRIEIPIPPTTFHRFYYTFPSGLDLKDKGAYSVFFEITDNDGNRGGKTRRSKEFQLRIYDRDELEERQLERQNSLLKGMGKAARQREGSLEEFEELLKNQKEKEALSFDDKEELREFFDKQEQQERLMEKFSRELSESMERSSGPEDELLKERLERQEQEARKNAALMEEMKKILDQLDKGELQERMEELSKAGKGSQRSMEQLLELTKRYYVQEISRQLGRKLAELSDKQLEESESAEVREQREEKQEALNEAFEQARKALEELEQDNERLKKPLPWQRDPKTEQSVSENQRDALEQLKEDPGEGEPGRSEEKDSEKETRDKQKGASAKMKQLSEALEQGASGGGGESISEDAEMLRQVLDNLVVFSLEQEALFSDVQKGAEDEIGRTGNVRKQQQLRQLFEHVDDSLFALSLRRAEISETVNTQITEVYYNIDKGLESFAENNWFRGASYQQYVFTAANELSAFLAELLDNMQDSLMPGKGQGEGSDFQLPDIIQSQKELQEKMQGMGQEKGSEGQEGGQGTQQGAGSEKDGEGSEGQEGGRGTQQGAGSETGGEGSEGAEGAQGQEDARGGDRSGKGEGKDGSGEEGDGGNEGGKRGNREGKGNEGGKEGDSGLSEAELAEYYEIYKAQQRIRTELERQLEDMISEEDRRLGERIALEMEQFENELLTGGITERTAERLNRIRQQLMQLENATLKQGEDDRRESNTNEIDFSLPVTSTPEQFRETENEIEYLNREALPLRRKFRDRVKLYFIGRDSVPLPNGG
jgi:hypothetical protein